MIRDIYDLSMVLIFSAVSYFFGLMHGASMGGR